MVFERGDKDGALVAIQKAQENGDCRLDMLCYSRGAMLARANDQ